MPSKATYGDFRNAIDRHLHVILRLEEKLLRRKERVWMRKGSIETIPDETELSRADEAEMLLVEQSSNALDPIAEPSDLWVC